MALSKSGPAGGKPNLGGKRPTFGGPKNGRPIVLPPRFGGPKNGRPNVHGPKVLQPGSNPGIGHLLPGPVPVDNFQPFKGPVVKGYGPKGRRPTFGGPKGGKPNLGQDGDVGIIRDPGRPPTPRPIINGQPYQGDRLKYAKGLDPALAGVLAGARAYAQGLHPRLRDTIIRHPSDSGPLRRPPARPYKPPKAQGRGSVSGRGQGELEDSRKALLTSQARRQTIAKALKLKRG